MVAFQPDFKEVAEASVLRNVTRRQVIVIIENRLVSCVSVIQATGSLGLEQEIFVNE